MTKIAVKIENISKSFKWRGKKFKALNNVSFDIRKGEIFGLLGPNGAGKTTLINILSTILTPDEGQASIFSYDIRKDQQKIMEIVNMVSGISNFHWKETPNEILDFYSRIYLVKDAKKEIRNLVNRLGISKFMNREFGKLSTGEKTRVLLAKSLINRPNFLMLDEPTLGLDPDISLKIRNLIKEINEKYNTTVLLTSHYMHEVEELCNRIAFINFGKVLDVGKIDELKSKETKGFMVKIASDKLPDKTWLKKNKMRVEEGKIVVNLKSELGVADLVEKLVKKGVKITNLETHRPNLEEYFIRMVEKCELPE